MRHHISQDGCHRNVERLRVPVDAIPQNLGVNTRQQRDSHRKVSNTFTLDICGDGQLYDCGFDITLARSGLDIAIDPTRFDACLPQGSVGCLDRKRERLCRYFRLVVVAHRQFRCLDVEEND